MSLGILCLKFNLRQVPFVLSQCFSPPPRGINGYQPEHLTKCLGGGTGEAREGY